MGIIYTKLWILLDKCGMKKKDLQAAENISSATITKLAKNENVNTDILQKICVALQCDISDIMEVVHEANDSK